MDKYIITNPDFEEVKSFFMNNFNAEKHVVAIGEFLNMTILATDDKEIVKAFNSEGYKTAFMHQRAIEKVMSHALRGHDEAIYHLTQT